MVATLALLVAAAAAGWLLARDRREGTIAAPPRAHDASSMDAKHRQGMALAKPTAGTARVASPRVPSPHVPGPLPPPDAPLSQTWRELKARADAGDGTAAARLFHDVWQCASVRGRLRILPMEMSVASAQGNPGERLSAGEIKAREQRLATLQQEMRDAQQQAARCEGLSEDQLRLAPAALTAARLGDKAASDCYVPGLLLFTGGLLDHPEWLSQYKDNVLAIANNALAAGDWTMVSELQHAYAPIGFRMGPLDDLVGEDPAMNYRLLRLRRLGAPNERAAEELDRQIATAAQDLPAGAISAGDAWAQDTFNAYFANQPPDSGNHGMGCPM